MFYCNNMLRISHPLTARRTISHAVASTARDEKVSVVKPPSVQIPEQNRIFYFAFGANMAQSVVQRRALKPRSAVPGTVRNYKLYFQHIGAYGTIEYRPDDTTRPDVHGVVLDISEAEMRRLAGIEGGYDVKDVVVTTGDGTRYRAKAFITNWSVRLFDEGLPTHDYIGKLRAGAEHHSLPAEYQDWLNGIKSRGYQQTTRSQLTSPSTYIAVGFSAALFSGAMAILVRPR
eukprot:jgi/Ulvmu1/6979/UM033_0037.1